MCNWCDFGHGSFARFEHALDEETSGFKVNPRNPGLDLLSDSALHQRNLVQSESFRGRWSAITAKQMGMLDHVRLLVVRICGHAK
jgi:hypothetical protein